MTPNLRNQLKAGILFSVVAMLAGCSDSKFNIAPVSGRITLDGQPVTGAQVVFVPQRRGSDNEAGYYSMGETDSDGRYSLRTLEKDRRQGAVVAAHRVFISKIQIDKTTGNDKQGIPSPYNDERTTPFEFTVEPGGSDQADFALSIKPG